MAVTVTSYGSAQNKTAAGTVTVTTTALIPANTLLVLGVCADNVAAATPTISSVTAVGGGTWTDRAGATTQSGASTTAGSGVFVYCQTLLTSSSVASGTVITVTFNASPVAKAVQLVGLTETSNTLRNTVVSAVSTAGTPSAVTAGTALVAGDIVVGVVGGENSTVPTGDADTLNGSWSTIAGIVTAGGQAATNTAVGIQYKVVTATGAQTYNPVTANDSVAIVLALQPLPPATVTQAAYRLYADGTETGSTALAAQDTAYTADLTSGDANVGVRVRLQSTNATSLDATDDWQLQWEKNASGTWANLAQTYLAAAYNNVADRTSVQILGAVLDRDSGAVSIHGDGRKLQRLGLWMNRLGSATGSLRGVLYAHTGTFGASGSTPTGAVLATSTNTVSSASLTLDPAFAWAYFDFDESFTLANGTDYFVGVELTGYTASDTANVRIGQDSTSPSYAGSVAYRTVSSGTWSYSPSVDYIFEVYTTPAPVVPHASANLTDADATTNRLGAGTGTFVAGKISEDGLVDDLGWSSGNYTELLYSLTLKQADLANSDTLRFRVLRNGATTGFTYTQTPTLNITVGAGIPSGTGTGAYAWAKGTVTGARISQGSTTRTYAFDKGAVTGTRTPKAQTSGAYVWAGTAVGDTPANHGTGTGAYSWSGTGTGTRAPKATATGAYAWAGASSGQRTPKATTAGTYTYAATATGRHTSQATTSGGYDWAGSSTGRRTPKAQTSGSYAFNAGPATGTRPPKAAGAGAYAWSGSGTGRRTPKAASTSDYNWAGTGFGTAPAVGGASGAAFGTVAWDGTAHASTPRRATATGAWAYAGTSAGATPHRATSGGSYAYTRGTTTGQRQPKGTTTRSYDYTGAGSGTKPTVPAHIGTGTGAHLWAGTAVGKRGTPKATATGTWLYVGTGSGSRAPKATSTGSYRWTGASVGVVTHAGQSVGTYLYVGTGSGSRALLRDIEVIPRQPRFTWTGHAELGGWDARQPRFTWTGHPNPSPWTAGRPRLTPTQRPRFNKEDTGAHIH